MFTRSFAFPLFCLLFLLSVSAAAQSGDISKPGTPGSGDPNIVPLASGDIPDSGRAVGSNTADQEGKIRFRSQTILIQVPVVVTDKYGNHIHGFVLAQPEMEKRRSPLV